MVTVADVLNFIQTIAPLSMKEDWDNVGLNCGRTDKAVQTILVALDPFEAACQEAADLGADLLVTHHALLWKPGFITDMSAQGRNTLFLIENGIAHINAHTNLDYAPGGVNDVLAATLGLSDIQVVTSRGIDNEGREWGLCRKGLVQEQPLAQFLQTVKEKLHCEALRYVDGGKPVRRVAVGSGACGGELYQAVKAGCDTYVTADVRYNQFWDAQSLGLNMIDAGHFHTENPVCTYLAEQLQRTFPDITVKISQHHTDCTKFFF